MDRNKPPALTSPWKIGFFVSLLLVALSIGVGFFITRSFDVAWTWVEFGDGSWSSWKFHLDGFMREMLPLVVVVPFFSLISYFLIAGAVRKYKAYLDSGLDYKNLVRSIRRIEDLQDESRIKKLNNHPELRDFLLNLRTRIQEREEAIAERELDVGEREQSIDSGEAIAAEVNVLLSAITAGREGFGNELALDNEQLKKIEQAIRDNFSSDDVAAQANLDETIANLRAAIVEDRSSLDKEFHDVRTELASCGDAARELEAHANRTRTEVSASASRGGASAAVAETVSGLDTISQTLSMLSEEAKGIAINAAMEASNGSNAEMVPFAESLRDIAARFASTTQEWASSSAAVRKNAEAAATGDVSDNGAEAVDAVAKQISMWVERTVILADKFRSFQKNWDKTLNAFEVKLGGSPDAADYHSMDDVGVSESHSEVQDTGDTAGAGTFTTDDTADDVAHEPNPEDTGIFERQTQSRMLDDAAVAASGIDGIEKDPDPLGEIAAKKAADEMFTDIPIQAEEPPQEMIPDVSAEPQAPADELPDVEVADVPAEEMFEEMAQPANEGAPIVPAPDAAETVDLPPIEPVSPPPSDDGFVTDPAVAAPARSAGNKPVLEEATAFQSTTVESEAVEEDGDVIDLYALGAVDFVADGVHQ